MISQFPVSPALQQWYNQKQLQPITHIKHDLHSGWIIAKLINKIYGDERFPLTSFDTNTSVKNAQHNWDRIQCITNQGKIPITLNAKIIQQIVEKKDEKQMFEILIQLYEQETQQHYPRQTIQAVKKNLAPKSPPQVLTYSQTNILLNTAPVAPQTANVVQFPPNIPHYCRTSYQNSRKLIDHMSSVCINSITQIPEIKDYTEMLDPRADYCFPFPQLLLRLPSPDYCLQVCKYMCDNVDIQLITECILYDYQTFNDFATVMLHSVVALNQVSGTANELFDIVTGHLCQVINQLHQQSEDIVYLVFNNIILAKILPELPLVNFSLIHFFRICMTCTQSLSTHLFNQLIQLALNNLKQYQPNISENRLRFEVLIAFTQLAKKTGKFKEQISRGCVKYALSGELLKDSEKYVALDLITRCCDLNPQLFDFIQFHFFRIMNVILNVHNLCIELDANMLDFDENIVQISVEYGRPGEKQKEIFDYVFFYNNVGNLNYQQIMFLITVMYKMQQYSPDNKQLQEVAKGLELKLVQDDNLPPCHFYIGVISILRRQQQQIQDLSQELIQSLDLPFPELEKKVQLLLQPEPQLDKFLKYLCQFLLNAQPSYLNSLFCLLNGCEDQRDFVTEMMNYGQFQKDHFLQFNQCQEMSNRSNNGLQSEKSFNSEDIENALNQSADVEQTKVKVDKNSNQVGIMHYQRNAYVDSEIPLPALIYKQIKQIYSLCRMEVVAPLLIYYTACNSQLNQNTAQLLFKLGVVNSQLCQFVYNKIQDQLFTAVISDNQQFSDSSIDLLVLIVMQLSMNDQCKDVMDEIRTSLQTLLEICFGYANKNQQIDIQLPKRQMMQQKTLKLMNQMKQVKTGRQIMVLTFEKMDYEAFGNDQLEKLIYEVSGEM